MKIVPLIKTIQLKRLKHILPLSFAIVALLGVSVGCKDKNKGDQDMSPCGLNPGSCKSVLETKDYFLFKVGSYWVYEEETSHERDSMYVIEYDNDEAGYNFYVNIKSSLTEYNYRYWPTYFGNITGCNEQGPISPRCIYVNRSKGKFQYDLGESQVFYINYHVGDWHYSGSTWDCPNNKVTIGQIYDSYDLPNYTLQNVIRVDQDCEYAEGKQPTKFYYSKNIGIIRKEFIDSNQVWNLVNYQVIQ